MFLSLCFILTCRYVCCILCSCCTHSDGCFFCYAGLLCRTRFTHLPDIVGAVFGYSYEYTLNLEGNKFFFCNLVEEIGNAIKAWHIVWLCFFIIIL